MSTYESRKNKGGSWMMLAAVAVLAAVVTGTWVRNAPAQPNPQYEQPARVTGVGTLVYGQSSYVLRVWNDGLVESRRLHGSSCGGLEIHFDDDTEWVTMVSGCE